MGALCRDGDGQSSLPVHQDGRQPAPGRLDPSLPGDSLSRQAGRQRRGHPAAGAGARSNVPVCSQQRDPGGCRRLPGPTSEDLLRQHRDSGPGCLVLYLQSCPSRVAHRREQPGGRCPETSDPSWPRSGADRRRGASIARSFGPRWQTKPSASATAGRCTGDGHAQG